MDPYSTLGVSKTSSDKDIKAAHRRLIRQWHPDRNPGKEDECLARSQEINSAYDLISTKEKRDALSLKESVNNMRDFGARQGFAGEDPLAEFFSRFTNGSFQGGWQSATTRQIYSVNITLEEAYQGTSREVNGHSFLIPKGIRTGSNLVLSQNEMVRINVLRHNKFQRSGDDLLLVAEVTAIEMMLGVELVVEALNGKKYRFKIPEGTQSGQNIKIQGMGMPNPEHDRYGDLFIQVNAVMPALTEEEKQHIMKVSHRQSINT